jgi:hypothetical protein
MHVPIYKKLKGTSYSITDVQANTISYHLGHGTYEFHSTKNARYHEDPNFDCHTSLLFVHDLNKNIYYFGPFIKLTGRTTVINQVLGYKLTEELFYKMVDEGKIIVLNEGFNKITKEEYHLLAKGTLTYSQLLNNIPD